MTWTIETIETIRFLGYEPFIKLDNGRKKLAAKKLRGDQTKKEKGLFVHMVEYANVRACEVVLNADKRGRPIG